MTMAELELGSLTVQSPARPGAGTPYERIKPVLDFAIGSILLLLTAPVALAAMLLVWMTSPGKAIYSQRRMGRGGKVFTIYKIRTMYENCEELSGAIWSFPGDSRITPVGRFLRATHLDELPQLVNVVLGEMSLVGPRPERPEFLPSLERFLPEYRRRFAVRPGMTGLAQVQQPPDTDVNSVRRKLELDLCYVAGMNAWLDLRLILATLLKCMGVSFRRIGRWLGLPAPDARVVVEPVAPQGLTDHQRSSTTRGDQDHNEMLTSTNQPPGPPISFHAQSYQGSGSDSGEMSSGSSDHR